MKLGEPMFLLLFDNVNKMQRAWQQTVGHEDEVKSGCAATLVGLEDVRPGAMNAKPFLENLQKKLRKDLTVSQLYNDINWDHIKGVGGATAMRVWTTHVPALAKFAPAVDTLFTETYSRHPLRLRKSDIHPMRTTDIDEAPTAGVAAELANLVLDQLQILSVWLQGWLIMVCGDQLSIDRLRKLKQYIAKTSTPFDKHEWALPVIQLWHLKWNWQKAIFRLHWFEPVGSTIFGLHHDCHDLRRDKFRPDKCDFYPAHHILEDRFDALMLDALRLVYVFLYPAQSLFLCFQCALRRAYKPHLSCENHPHRRTSTIFSVWPP